MYLVCGPTPYMWAISDSGCPYLAFAATPCRLARDAIAPKDKWTKQYPLYERRFLIFRAYNVRAHLWDLAVIVGGLEVRFPNWSTQLREGLTFLRTGRLAHPEVFYEVIENPQDPNSPYSPYYLGYEAFGATGFRYPEYRESRTEEQAREENQVRHFMAGVGLSYFYGRLGEQLALSRETPGSPDYRLYEEGAFPLARLLALFAFQSGGPPPDLGDWIRETVGATGGTR